MEFLVERTSVWAAIDFKKPCKEAIAKEFVYIDRRTAKTLIEAKLPKHKHWADEFFSRGTNHREERGMIARDLESQKKWVINIDTLEDLIKLVNKYGDIIVVQVDDYKGIELCIEIYDGYRK